MEPARHDQPIALLAERLRVEERQLIAAFEARGYAAELRASDALALPLGECDDQPALPWLAIDRSAATPERAALGALLTERGTAVVNRTATTRLLADRLALLRHLLVARIPVPPTRVCFGEPATIAALRAAGYPALVLSPTVDPTLPDAVVHDHDSAEAIVEHRATLGHAGMTLVQSSIAGEELRLAVVGDAVIGIESVTWQDDGSAGDTLTAGHDELRALGAAVIARLGSGVYGITLVAGTSGPVVTGVSNLIDFRSLAASGVDVAGGIADFACSHATTGEGRGTR